MKRYLLGGALVGVALIVMIAASRVGHSKTAADGTGATPAPTMLGAADVATVGRADLIAGLPVSGTLEPSVEVRIASPIPEVVERVLVKEGQAVRQGQVLARFRTNALEPEALSAEARRRKAASDYGRMQNLFAEGAVSQQDVENAEVALRAAQAAEALARKKLDEATIRAPVSGVISERKVDSGDRVKDGDQLFELVNTNELEFEATVPSEYVSELRVGAPVVLGGPGLPASGVGGRVARINATADPATRQVQIYVTVPNRAAHIVAGLFASGRVVLREVRGAVAVPRAGVRTDPSGATYVLVVANGRIERRDVTIGAVDDVAELVEIVRGLAGGETAVIGPAEGLRPGQPVAVARQED